jgi:hypothetical protein
MSTSVDIGPLHHHRSQVHHDGIHHISLLSKDDGSCSMRYKSDIVVSVNLIFQEFDYVSFKATFDYITFSWKLCYFPFFTLVVDIAP